MSETLADRRCTPCDGGTPPVTDDRAAALLSRLDGWAIAAARLSRRFPVADMVRGAELVVLIAALAETEGHHPVLRLTWRTLDVCIWTHAIGALSENDFLLAAGIDRLVARSLPGSG